MTKTDAALKVLTDWEEAEEWANDSETIAELAAAVRQLKESIHRINGFEARQSSDELKTDLELTCVHCGFVVCDVEHGDSLPTLLATMEEHWCIHNNCERHGGPWGEDPTCERCTHEDGTVRSIEDPGPLFTEEAV